MSQQYPQANQQQKTLPHIAHVDLYNNGVAHEVAIMKRDRVNGDVYFIPVSSLDRVDRKRLGNILSRRDATRYELWDLLSQVTLGNGQNALEMFHQLTQVRTQTGQVFSALTGKRGMPIVFQPNPQQPIAPQSYPEGPPSPQMGTAPVEVSADVAAMPAVPAPAQAAAPKAKGRGRPPKAK